MNDNEQQPAVIDVRRRSLYYTLTPTDSICRNTEFTRLLWTVSGTIK